MRQIMNPAPAALLASLVGMTMMPGWAAAPRNLCDTVKPRATYPGALRASEVCMRSLVPRSANAKNPHDTLQAIRDFHVTRLEWIYNLTPAFVTRAKALGVTVSGACVNGCLAGVDKKAPDWYMPYTTLDLDGNAVEAPWMRPWRGHMLWECINNPEAREAYLRYVKGLVDLGVADLQRDGPEMNHSATSWGGCFCRYCIPGFRKYLKQYGNRAQMTEAGVADLEGFDYAAHLRARNAPVGDAFRQYPRDYLKGEFLKFQEQSTVEFHQWWRKELDAYAGRHVPVSSNNGMSNFGPVHSVFDRWIGELSWSQAQPETLWEAARQARELGKGQSTTMPLRHDAVETPEWILRTRQTIATNYALGMHIEAPWDTYLPIVTESPARYFGKAEDYADLFAMVRASASLLDGYEEAAVGGGLLTDGRWTASTAPVTVFAGGRRVYSFTRALPGKPNAPVVTHLVDWSGEPQSLTVSLNPEALFAGRPVRISLITPKPYDRQAHVAAFDSHDYAPLVVETVLGDGWATTVQVPPLRPWGLLVVRLLTGPAGVWAPWAGLVEQGGAWALKLNSPDESTALRFTTDDAEPTPASAAYTDALPVSGLTQVRARAYRGGEASPVTVIAHLPPAKEGLHDLLINGDFTAGTAGWTPVVFREIGDKGALSFTVERIAKLGNAYGARLTVAKSDGVPYHLRLTQPVTVKADAVLFLTSTLMADRPTRVRLGVQEARPPHRVVMVRIVEIGPEPTAMKLSLHSQHPELRAQYQLDLGYAEPGTTVWLSGARVREMWTQP